MGVIVRAALGGWLVVLCLILLRGELAVAGEAAPTLLFAVLEYRGGRVIDPVVRIDRTGFSVPTPLFEPGLTDDQREATLRRFEAEWYPRGRRYRLLVGGAEVGTATVLQPVGISCESQAAAVELQSSVAIPSDSMALVTTAGGPVRREVRRRSPATPERAAAIATARSVYRSRAVPTALLTRVTAQRLVAADLDGDGRFELVGTFLIEAPTARHGLFLVVEPQPGGGYRPALVSYHRSLDLVDGKDRVEQLLVDQVRLGRGPTDALVTVSAAYESAWYTVYERKGPRWRETYRGAGFGC